MQENTIRTPLAQYFDAHPEDTQAQLSERIHAARGYGNPPPQSLISKWATGRQIPHPAQRLAIQSATFGVVTVEAWEEYEKARSA